jgi:putative colanic acid biosynthesis acetyltransferase WcaF
VSESLAAYRDSKLKTQNSKLALTMVSTYTAPNKLGRVLWWIVYMSLFRYSPRPLHGWRSFLLRCFGARLGTRCHIYASAKIWAPWNLECGPLACISNDAEIYNPVTVVLGEGVVVSQGAFLCAASHDYKDPTFPVIHGPIVLGKRAWVAARAIVLMGVTIGEGSVIGAGSVVTRDVPPYTLCAGNPARVVRKISR